MDDIFAAAKQGNKASIKGLYNSSVSSAYGAVSAVVEDEQAAAEIVKEIYISAFSQAATYDEFFQLLNKRATTACSLALSKSVKINTIAPTQGAFADLAEMALPEELKHFDASLANIVVTDTEQKKKKKAFSKSKKREPATQAGELKSFNEYLQKQEFADFDDYEPEKEEEEQKPKSLAEKLQREEIEISSEQALLEQKELLKNKRTAIIAFVLAAVILAGAVSTYFITKHVLEHKAQSDISAVAVNTEPHLDKTYNEKQAIEAYRDYLNKVLIKKFGKATTERVVSYNETGDVGSSRLNGLISYKVLDIDGDKKMELAAVICQVNYDNKNFYTYQFKLFLYRFADKKVKAIKEDYPLIEYSTYNRGEDYHFGSFNMFIKQVKTEKGEYYLYAEAAGKDMMVSSYHYYESDKLFEAERFAFFRWDKQNMIFMQRRLDGTYEPLYLMLRGMYEENADKISQDFKEQMGEYGFRLGNAHVKCASGKAFAKMYNEAFKRLGYKLESWNFSADTEDKKDYICYLRSLEEQGDMLSKRTVVKLVDFSALDAFLEGGDPMREEEDETTEVELVDIPTTAPTTTTTKKETTTKEEETTEEETTKQTQAPTTRATTQAPNTRATTQAPTQAPSRAQAQP
ncbi:MAG: hypothetical protein IJJ41_04575 [Clostridia bacterium]|nr:hypothetical protein [Clostridia bacterium]